MLVSASKKIGKHVSQQIETFCKMIHVSYEVYEKALSTTKKGKVLYLERRIEERWINNYNPEMLFLVVRKDSIL